MLSTASRSEPTERGRPWRGAYVVWIMSSSTASAASSRNTPARDHGAGNRTSATITADAADGGDGRSIQPVPSTSGIAAPTPRR